MQTSITGKINLLGLNLAALQSFFADLGEKPFRAGQVMQWIHHYGATDFDAMTNLSKALRTRLQESAEIHYLRGRAGQPEPA
jgi:23S rRNA (adenine2503-C2)-methyltransferase